MAKTLYLLNFKNYFNREIEVPGNAIDDYTHAGYSLLNTINNMSLWNPNDGVNTVITTTWYTNTIPNYVIVTPDNSGIIESRWWVIKHERIAGTQYRLYLRRDLIADNLKLVLNNEHSYVVRGYCGDTSDIVYNKEDLKFNQVKTDQIPLYDDTGCPWIVMYLKLPGIAKHEGTEMTPTTYYVDYPAVNGLYSLYRLSNAFPTIGQELMSFGVYWNTGGSTATGEQAFAITPIGGLPYTVLTLPYANHIQHTAKGDITITKDMSMAIMSSLQQLMGEWVMDIQLVPYCPFAMNPQHRKNLVLYLSYDDYYQSGLVPIFGSDTDNPYAFVLQSPTVSRSDFDLCYYPTDGSTLTKYQYTVKDLKEDFNTKSFRLCSPTDDSAWDFNPAETVTASGGTISFQADQTLQPYRSYVNVKPVFKRLYGKQYMDYRGLIASGDYSLPQTSSAWISYENNNKSYYKSFQRNIETLKLQQKTELVNDVAGIATSTAAGAAAGAMVGGGVGAIVGAAAGAVASVVDMVANAGLRKDELDNTIRQFNLQNKAIGARPTTVGNVNTFNVDNLFVPRLEIYECTAEEKVLYRNYIQENGYAINQYGKLSQFANEGVLWYYKILCDRLWYWQISKDGTKTRVDFIGDSYMLDQLINECKQGFYYEYLNI